MAKSLFERKVSKMANTRLTTTHNNKTGKTSHARSYKNPQTGKSSRSK